MILRRNSCALFALLLLATFFRHTTQTFGSDADFLRIETVLFPDGRVAYVGLNPSNSVSVKWQNDSNATFATWTELPGKPLFKEVRGLASAGDVLSVFALSREGQVWFNQQTNFNMGSQWRPVGDIRGFSRITPVFSLDQKLICFAIGEGLVWMNLHSPSQQRWTGWKRVEGVAGVGQLRAVPLQGGGIELFAIGLRTGSWSNQRTASGEWGYWKEEPTTLPSSGRKTLDAPAMFYDSGSGSLKIFRWISHRSNFALLPMEGLPRGYSVASIKSHMVATDVDGDGRTDNVVAYQYPGPMMRLHVFLNGSDYQGPRGWFQHDRLDMSRIDGRMVAGDFNGDGHGDVAMFHRDDNGLNILRFLSTGSSFISDGTKLERYDLSQVGEHIVATDVNGDGRTDIVAAYQKPDGTMRLQVFAGGLSFSGDQGWYQSGRFDLRRVAGRMAGGDFDGNGKGDIIMFYDSPDGPKIFRFLSTGSSFKSESTLLPSDYRLAQMGDRLTAGDVNGDGAADAVSAYEEGEGQLRLHVFLNGNSYSGPAGWFSSNDFNLKLVEGRFTMGQWLPLPFAPGDRK